MTGGGFLHSGEYPQNSGFSSKKREFGFGCTLKSVKLKICLAGVNV
jgi:hypothetical protein